MPDTNKPDNEGLEYYYILIVNLWQQFCEAHSILYQLTCDEYSLLLSNEMEMLDQAIRKKEAVINSIKKLEEKRLNLIVKLNQQFNLSFNIKSVSDLIMLFQEYEGDKGSRHLKKFNALLISIIEKIQEQNKKNQFFLNKSLKSIRKIKDGLLGKKTFQTYNSQGISNSHQIK